MDDSAQEPKVRKPHSDAQVLFFIIGLCLICALILAIAAYSLQTAQTNAKEFDRSKQMLIAAKVLAHKGQFIILEEQGKLIPARFDAEKKILVPVEETPAPKAKEEEIKTIATLRIRPMLTDQEGNVFTLEEKGFDLSEYLEKNKKTGYANLPFKLFYTILDNTPEAEKITEKDLKENIKKNVYCYVIPVSGFGLWAPIYGYIAIALNGDTVIGTTWYEHAETPGLGANITEQWWQKQFYGKEIFQESAGGAVDFKTADIGIIVVKGKVKDVFGNSPKAKSAADGMSGATLTGDGVTAGYRNSLSPYRQFFIKLHEMKAEKEGKKNGRKESSS